MVKASCLIFPWFLPGFENSNANDCSYTGYQDKPTCPDGNNAIYWESGDGKNDGKVYVYCCKSGSDDGKHLFNKIIYQFIKSYQNLFPTVVSHNAEAHQKQKVTECRATDCVPPNIAGPNNNLCSTLKPRFVDGKQQEFVETIRDDCLQDDA